MKIYNTLTRRVEEIVPLQAGKVKMYSCGPTVYRFIHIGNLRTFTMADWIRRAFEYRGFEVFHVKNITDVGHMRQEMVDRGEDKMLAQARKEGKTSLQIAQFYTEAFHEDERKLNIEPATVFPRATEHIPEMIAIVQELESKGVAYEVNGNVYFDIKRFPGSLSPTTGSTPSIYSPTGRRWRNRRAMPIPALKLRRAASTPYLCATFTLPRSIAAASTSPSVR